MKRKRKTTAILVAAGKSLRMGSSKQLLTFGGKPAINHILDTLIAADITDVVVVLSEDSGPIRHAIKERHIHIVVNSHFAGDMASSIRIGLAATHKNSKSVFVCLVDHPLVSVKTYRSLKQYHAERPDLIHVPVYGERRGHPTVLPKSILYTIHNLPTLRDVISHHSNKVSLVSVTDAGVVMDMDTPRDYIALLGKFYSGAGVCANTLNGVVDVK